MKKRRPTWIPVVAAMISKGDKVLLGLRPEGSSLSGVWEFPGGKIEPNETPIQALERELTEELDIQADIGELLSASSHNYGDVNILLLVYQVNYWKGEPRNQHHHELKWFHLDELSDLDLPDANKKILQQLLNSI